MNNIINNKIVKSIPELIEIISKERSNGNIISMISGSFDLLHYGHIEILEKIKADKKTLVVLLNSDKSVRAYKGFGRPIIKQRERALSLSALSSVNYIYIFNTLNTLKIIKKIQPEEYWNGSDWSKDCIEKDVVESYGGILKIHQRGKDSTSKVIERIIDVNGLRTKKAIFYQKIEGLHLFSKKFLVKINKYGLGLININDTKKLENVLIKLAYDQDISLNKSWLISNDRNLLLAAKKVNLRTINPGSKTSDSNVLKLIIND